jgi:hypothetical protein
MWNDADAWPVRGPRNTGVNMYPGIDWTHRKKVETPEEIEEAIADMMIQRFDGNPQMTDAEFKEGQAELIRARLIVDSGRQRDGCIMWVISEKGRETLREHLKL